MSKENTVINVMVCDDDGASVHISEVMAEFQCFKVVQAAEIKSVAQLEESNDLSLIIGIPGTDVDLPYLAAEELTQRYKPETGDYLVLYENGYLSISPKKVFEDGYSKIEFAEFEGADDLGIPKEHMGQVLAIAKMCHSVNCAYLQATRESFKPWESLEQNDKDRVIEQVAFIIINPDKSVSAWHDAWVAKMLVAGWKFGHKRSIKSKTHEQLKPFHHLPEMQQVKDSLYFTVVHQAVHGV